MLIRLRTNTYTKNVKNKTIRLKPYENRIFCFFGAYAPHNVRSQKTKKRLKKFIFESFVRLEPYKKKFYAFVRLEPYEKQER